MAEKEYKLTKDAAGIDATLNAALRFDIPQELTARQKAQVLETLGLDASKLNFEILGYFDTFDELEAAITNPEPGDAYGVGMAYPYDIYIWDNLRGRWVNNGPIRGADGEDGADAEVTAETIEEALGYTPADANEEIGFDRLKRTAKTLAWRNITVPDSAWEEVSTSQLYPWRAAIELPGSGVDATYKPQVEFDEYSRGNADLSPDCTSFDDGVFIYAAAAPEILVFIENITCTPTLVEAFESSVFASIAVTYAAGASVSCTDGTTTLTAKSTSGRWTFAIPYAGTWLISDGENEQSVSITEQGQTVSVDLVVPWDGYLYKAGDEYTDITGGWVQYQEQSFALGTISKEADRITTATSTNQTCNICTKNKIDLTNAQTLKCTLYKYESDSSTTASAYIGASAVDPVVSGYGHDQTRTINFYGTTAELDVSDLAGEYYIYYGTGFVVYSELEGLNLVPKE